MTYTGTSFSMANISLMAEADQSRIFGLDAQLLFDVLIQGLAVFLLFLFLSYILIEPVKKVIADRQAKIKGDLDSAAKDKEEAAKLKAEYDEKIKQADDEAEEILTAARKKAVKNEENIVAEAKEEAARIINRANQEAELEKNKVKGSDVWETQFDVDREFEGFQVDKKGNYYLLVNKYPEVMTNQDLAKWQLKKSDFDKYGDYIWPDDTDEDDE